MKSHRWKIVARDYPQGVIKSEGHGLKLRRRSEVVDIGQEVWASHPLASSELTDC